MVRLLLKLKAVSKEATFPVLMALCAVHCFNDLLQSVVSAVYPMLKDDLDLSFGQIGLVTLVYQIAASVFQPPQHRIQWGLSNYSKTPSHLGYQIWYQYTYLAQPMSPHLCP